jgi:2-oxoglutarate ferredoxin oxidoreductase subunit alpha
MVRAGDGYGVHVTGLTHDEKGYPAMDWRSQASLVKRLVDKIRLNAPKIVRYQEERTEDAEVILVAYGITSRIVQRAVEMAREEKLRAGLLRPVVVWPFPEERLRELSKKARAFVVVEMNYGQVVHEVERCVGGRAPTILVPHGGGAVHEPEEILKFIRQACQ